MPRSRLLRPSDSAQESELRTPASPSRTTRVLIFGDIRLFRLGLTLLLQRQRRMRPVATVGVLADALEAFREFEPDVVLLDGASVDSVDACRELVAAEPDIRVVVLGVEEREAEVIAYAEAGVAGYVTRDADTRELCDALETVAGGGTLCSPHIAATLLKRVATLSAQRPETQRTSRLTIREREIVELMRDGLSNKEIAQRLCIEVATVKNHVHNILDKLDVRRRGDVAAVLRA